jgi:CheY-like chemotaxis protein
MLMQRLVGRVRPDATIHTAADGQAALALWQQAAPALIVSDVSMPVMSGIDLVTALRAAGAQLPIILVSADPGHEQDALGAGADAFVFKPELVRQLPPLLRRLL